MKTLATRKNIVLLVEDNPGDVRLTTEALKDERIECQMFLAEDGNEALSFLRQENKYSQMPSPDLILLDLNLPKKNGREVLDEIKSDRRLKKIPVIILTSSMSEADVHTAYRLHANCYITKPTDIDEFFRVVKSIGEYWFSTARLPREEIWISDP